MRAFCNRRYQLQCSSLKSYFAKYNDLGKLATNLKFLYIRYLGLLLVKMTIKLHGHRGDFLSILFMYHVSNCCLASVVKL